MPANRLGPGGCHDSTIGVIVTKPQNPNTTEGMPASNSTSLRNTTAKRFEAEHQDVRINVQTGGSSRGITDTTRGLSDIGMSSRKLRESEASDRIEWPIAVDGICFIVNSANPVNELSDEHLKQILTGQIDNWRVVGGIDTPIVLINRASGRSELELVTNYFSIAPADIRADLIAGENQEGIKLVSQSAGRITYISVGASEYATAAGVKIKMLPLNGVEATSANVAAGKYPLARPLLFITTSSPTLLAQRFIEFAQSDRVHDLIREMSYVAIDD